MTSVFIFGLLIALMLTGMPISIALGMTVLTFIYTMTNVPTESVALKLFTGIDNFEIMAIPFFILAGNFLTHGGVARRMINFATSMVGHWYGGLGLAGVMACALFAAVSGSSPATVIAIGSIMLPAMVKQGLPKRFGAGVITTSGALGILIPPSIVMVIYCVATGGSIALDPAGHRVSSASVGQMFMAGVIPGLMLATLLGLTTFYRAWKFDYPRLPKANWTERFVAFRKCMWGLLLILIVLGGIYAGLFTPTEAAAISAVYAFVIAVFVYRDMSLKDVPRVLLGSANMSAMILYIITNAVLFSFLMANENIPQQIAAWITSIGVDWIIFLLIVNVLLLIAGNVMEASSIVLIMAPILFPVAIKLGIHPVHLGILMVVNMEVGMCHPPVGLNLYVASGIAKMGITELTIAVWPWLLTMLIFLGVVTYVPEISLWLPRALHLDPKLGAVGLTASAGLAGWVEFALLRRLAGHAGQPLQAPEPHPLPRMAGYLPGVGAVDLDLEQRGAFVVHGFCRGTRHAFSIASIGGSVPGSGRRGAVSSSGRQRIARKAGES